MRKPKEAFRSRGSAAAALLLAGLSLWGCSNDPPLPAGCYYAEDGTAVLKLDGDRGFVLLPGQIKELQLRWHGGQVNVTPAFYLLDPPLRTERNPALPSVDMPVLRKPQPTIQILYAPAGHLPATLGKPC